MTTNSFTKDIKLKPENIPNIIKAMESTKRPKIDKDLKDKVLNQDEVNKIFKKDGIINDNTSDSI